MQGSGGEALFAFVVEDEAFEFRTDAEVEQKADLYRGGPEVVEQLRLVGRIDVAGAFEFKDYGSLDHDVGEEQSDLRAPEPDGNRHLPFSSQSRVPQPDHQRAFTHGLQEPIP